MNDTIGGRLGPSVQQTYDDISSAVPPLPHRRPRVREVNSRFMSPVATASSFSSGDLHILTAKSSLPKHVISIPTPAEFQARQQRSKSVQRRLREQELLCRADENIPDNIPSLDTSLGSQTHGKALVSANGKQRTAVKIFKENGGARARARTEYQQLSDVLQSKGLIAGSGKCSRPDTPTVNAADRIIPSRYRLTTHNLQRPTPTGGAVTAAANLLQSSGMSLSAQPSDVDTKVTENSCQEATSFPVNPCATGDDAINDKVVEQDLAKFRTLTDSNSCSATTKGSTCPNSPVPIHNNKTKSLSDMRSSMQEVDMLPTVSNRLLAERSCIINNVSDCDSAKCSASPCSRSLNSPLSSCEHLNRLSKSFSQSLKTSERTAYSISKLSANTVQMGSHCLPPRPACIKVGVGVGVDARNGRKVFNYQEEVHSLKLLHNHYLQWRYANAKAEASMNAQMRETERKLYSLGVGISGLRDAVERKCIELGLLQRTKTLSTILEAHMPYLDEWSSLKEEYSTSLSGAINDLLNSSIQLPVSGNIRANTREIEKSLNSAIMMTEMIVFHLLSFMPKAEETDTLISELTKVIRGERVLVEECGDMLFKTYASQVEECSLRGHLLQLLHRSNHCQN